MHCQSESWQMQHHDRPFDIQAVLPADLADAAEFLARWFSSRHPASDSPGAQEDALVLLNRLRWLLLENPAVRSDTPRGFCLRDRSGKMRGLNLCFPAAFLWEDQRLAGLGSGSYFVEPEAQSLGFFLFKKYLAIPGYSFFFATTCNANSALLWSKLGGQPVADSELEYILPLRLDRVLPAFVTEKTSSEAARKCASILGRCANLLWQLRRPRSSRLTISPTQDWQKLSDLFYRHRRREHITAERSPEFLRWRYGRNTDAFPAGVCLVRDARGHEGWFALGNVVRGRRRQIRGSVLLDAVWPREHISFQQIVASMLEYVESRTDAIWFRVRPEIDCSGCRGGMIPLKRGAPSTFVIRRKNDRPLPAGAWDLTPADGDTALPLSPLEHPAMEPCVTEGR